MKCLSLLSLLFLLTLIGPYAVADKGCPPGEYSVRGHFRKGYIRSDGTMVRPTNVKTYCKLLTKVYEYANKRFKSGLPSNWPHKSEKPSVWSEDERERVIEVLDELPDILLSDKIEGIYRAKKSKDYPNPGSSLDGIVIIYDSAFSSSRNLGRIVAHELSHQSYKDLSSEDKQDYRRVTGWKLKLESDRNVYWVGRKDGYVENDGKFSHEEDYTNNLEHYLYDPDKLKKVTPSAYEWFKKHFGSDFQTKGHKK